MPLVRLEVRNEYGLGQAELYKEASREDPKAVLDGVAVAGLVGILRQLGDLAEFAAEVFHGLQEQVMTTASRSHKLKVRVQRIEAALPPLEKAVLAQTSHIHFAYTAGSEWHARIRNEQSHFIYNDLPRFVMDSYEECRDPPRLHLLDKFDTGGPGSCLKRYSDPTFFKRASATSDEASAEKFQSNRKSSRSKKKRSSQRNGEVSRGASMSNGSGRLQFTSPAVNDRTSPLQTASTVDMTSKSDLGGHSNSFDSSGLQFTSHIINGRTSPSQTASTVDMALKSDPGDHSHSFDSRTGSGYIECVFHQSSARQPEEQESPSSSLTQHNDTLDSVFPDEQTKAVDDKFLQSSSPEQIVSSSCVTWDEKAEIVEPKSQQSDIDEAPEMLLTKSEADTHGGRAVNFRNVDQMDSLFDHENRLESISSMSQIDDIESEPDNYMDALNTIESESENDLDCQTKREVERYASNINEETDEIHELPVHSSEHHPPELESHTISCISLNIGIPSNLPSSVSPESFAQEQMPQIVETSSNSDQPVDIDFRESSDFPESADIHDGSNYESAVGGPLSSASKISDLQDKLRDKITSGFHESQETPADFPGGQSIKFWTNGGLLGHDGSNYESAVSGPLSSASKISDLQDKSRDKITSGFHESQETPADFPGGQSIKFWTNGGLLGLQPSKPPDFTISNAVSQDSVNRSKDETVGPSACSFTLKGNEHEGKQDMLAEKAGGNERASSCECSTSCYDDAEDGVFTKKTGWGSSPADSDAKCENFNVTAPETATPLTLDVKSTSTEANQENDENSSLVFGLSRRLLANGFHRKVSLGGDEKCEPASSVNSGVLDQSRGQYRVVNQTIPEITFEEQFGHGSSVDSLTSSPPLEHMKISFHPLNGFETSKLKLKFPDGSQCRESIRDVFPSFQLVPEPDIPLHDFGSESDDDTFCRSSPYKSDDCHSYHSESNSEQWESGETPAGKDLELYDALCGISSAESIPSLLEFGETGNNGICVGGIKSEDTGNGVESSLSARFLDLPSFDAVNTVLKQETRNGSNLLELECPQQTTPQPPPLPPVQWRVSQPHLDVTEDKQDIVSEALEHAFDLKLLGSTVFPQPKPVPTKQQQINEAAAIKPKREQQDRQKLNGQNEANQAMNGKEMDEREDFLQQIRSKSFNLKRTVTTKSTNTAGPTANVKVTAILEKANAIRQAVGSDNGDDDDAWSDA